MRTFTALVLLVSTPALAGDWEVIDTTDGIVTSRRAVEGSNMLAFRGEGDSDLHIGRFLTVLTQTELGPDWVDMLIQADELEVAGPDDTTIYQVYDLSWPISDRDYLMRRKVELDPASKIATVTYNSVESSVKPASDCCVRAYVHRTYWRLTSKPDGGTHIEVEVHTDPKGSLPAWVVNLVQRGWPRNSIVGLRDRAAKEDIEPRADLGSW